MPRAGTTTDQVIAIPTNSDEKPAVVNTGNRGIQRWLAGLVLPSIGAGTVFVAAALWNRPIDVPHLLVAFLVFFIQHRGPWSGRVEFGSQVLMPWFGTAAVLLLVGYLTSSIDLFGEYEVYTWFVLAPLLQGVALTMMPSVLAGLVRLWRREHRVLVVGATPAGMGFGRALGDDPLAHAKVVGYFDDRSAARLGVGTGAVPVGRLADVPRVAREERIDQIFVALPLAANSRVAALIESLRDSTASVYLLPDVTAVNLVQPRVDAKSGFPIVGICESPLQGINGLAKRSVDVVVSSLALLAILPLLAVIAAAVRFSGPGPVIFKQRRFGLDGSEFLVWKFRSMKVVEDGSSTYTQAERNDPRITRVGAFLRRTSLDELPQLFNVLQGTMSLVGPRPHALRVNENYRHQITGYMTRHKVRPGITGWAQVNGARGGDDLASMQRRIAYDLEYLRNWSLALDFKILLLSIRVIWNDTAAY